MKKALITGVLGQDGSYLAKLKKLNWKPEMDIQEGLQRTFDWFQSRMNS